MPTPIRIPVAGALARAARPRSSNARETPEQRGFVAKVLDRLGLPRNATMADVNAKLDQLTAPPKAAAKRATPAQRRQAAENSLYASIYGAR